MERIEAGFKTPPLHPGYERRSQPAFLLRTNETPFTTTEHFRTGTQGLFKTIRSELATSFRDVPTPYIFQDGDQPLTVAIASGNNRKIDSLMNHMSKHPVDIVRIPEAKETHVENTIVDAMSKVLSTRQFLSETTDEARRDIRNRPHIIIANDQLNAFPTLSIDPVTRMPFIAFERAGKPKGETREEQIRSIQERFTDMAALGDIYNWNFVPYIIELATIIHNPQDPDNNAVSLQKTAVFLSRDGMRHVATDRFDEYVREVSKTYDITGIAGGIEIDVLDKMGVVEFISGTVSEITPLGFPPRQRPEAKDHAIGLALGHADEWLISEYFGQDLTPTP